VESAYYSYRILAPKFVFGKTSDVKIHTKYRQLAETITHLLPLKAHSCINMDIKITSMLNEVLV